MTSDVVTLSSEAAATGANSAHLLGKPSRSYGVEIEWTVTGAGHDKAISALVVSIEGSLTGTTFQAMDTAITCSEAELTAKYALRYIVDKPVKYIRSNPTTVTITGSTGVVTLTIKVLPVR